ncbi:MAG: arylsulfatase A-like enzyme, partial [Myxococcota bacterium]
YAERPRGPYSRGLRALIDGDWKITWKAAGNKYELYDLAADPDEMDNQMRKRPDQARRMQAALQSMLRLALDTKDKVQ